jgi:hypothetical protein
MSKIKFKGIYNVEGLDILRIIFDIKVQPDCPRVFSPNIILTILNI